jgi:hypothetical protein
MDCGGRRPVTIVALGSAKGSPGTTTTVLAIAASWPEHREPLVVELDPAGGDILPMLTSVHDGPGGLQQQPSLIQLATTARSGLSEHDVLGSLQTLPGPGAVRTLVAPASPFGSSTAIAALVAAGFGDRLRGLSGLDALVDVGRIDPTSPALAFVRWLGRVVLVTRSNLASILHTRELAANLDTLGIAVSMVVVGERPYPPGEVQAALTSVTLVGVLPDDPSGAAALGKEAPGKRSAARSRLLRAATSISAELCAAPQQHASAADFGAVAPPELEHQ